MKTGKAAGSLATPGLKSASKNYLRAPSSASLAQSQPAVARAEATAVEPGSKFGAWLVAAVDPTGRKALCVCRCQTANQVAVDALRSGSNQGCGCTLTPRPPREHHDASFSAKVTGGEYYAALHRTKARP